jgi:Flp pilus assembly pilin Flp
MNVITPGGALVPTRAIRMAARRLLPALAHEESGADLVEYSLLSAIVAVALVEIAPTLEAALGTALGNWGTGVYNLWLP